MKTKIMKYIAKKLVQNIDDVDEIVEVFLFFSANKVDDFHWAIRAHFIHPYSSTHKVINSEWNKNKF